MDACEFEMDGAEFEMIGVASKTTIVTASGTRNDKSGTLWLLSRISQHESANGNIMDKLF